MNQSTRKMLNSSERQLLRETEPAKLRKADEDELVELHRRVRRARTKYATLYRRRASAQVKKHGTRAMASKANKRTSVKAEVFVGLIALAGEYAGTARLPHVSSALARAIAYATMLRAAVRSNWRYAFLRVSAALTASPPVTASL